MYRVEWDDHEGNRHELSFDSLEGADLEVEALMNEYDYVAIIGGTKNE